MYQNSAFNTLRDMNPPRIRFIRDNIARFFPDIRGLSVLDCGCGIGIATESLSRMGSRVVGVDVDPRNIETANTKKRWLNIEYECAEFEKWEYNGVFDVVLALEVIEHCADAKIFIMQCMRYLKTGGLLFISTLNKNLISWVFGKIAAEYVLGFAPRGTHDWNKFITPGKLRLLLNSAGCEVVRLSGIKYSVTGMEWTLDPDHSVNYIMCATKVR